MWTRMLLISIAENLKDLDATQARLLKNPKDIANIFRRFYGDVVANKIQQLLTEHLVIGKDLIVALKNKNADEMADAFNSINPFYPKEEMRKMLYEHLRLTTDEVNRRLQGDYIGDINAFDKVQIEILKMSQFLVNGIVKQFQNLF